MVLFLGVSLRLTPQLLGSSTIIENSCMKIIYITELHFWFAIYHNKLDSYRMYEVAISYPAGEQVSVRMQVIVIAHVVGELNQHIPLLECIAFLTNANQLVFHYFLTFSPISLSTRVVKFNLSEWGNWTDLDAVTVLKFGHMSSDLLAYGASDGSLTVCTVSEPPSIIKSLMGHSKDVTGSINWYYFCSLLLHLKLFCRIFVNLLFCRVKRSRISYLNSNITLQQWGNIWLFTCL